jgi:4-diphosphocytidyl-2C-methyl-D-erythritol kinase
MFSSLGVNTGEAYGWLAAAREHAGAASATAGVLHPDRLSEWEQIVELATNDFEPVVAERHPAIKMMLEMLRDAGDFSPVLLAGSGSAVFGVAPDGVTPWGAVTAIEGESHEAQAEGSMRPLRVTTTATAQRVEPVVVLD